MKLSRQIAGSPFFFHGVISAMRMDRLGADSEAPGVFRFLRPVDKGAVLVRCLASGESVLLLCDAALPVQFTSYHPRLVASDPLTLAIEPSDIFEALCDTERFLENVLDLCAGTGAMGFATSFLGTSSTCFCDLNPLASKHLRESSQLPVFEGDVGDVVLIEDMHKTLRTTGQSFTVLAGFPCQPFSQQGLQLHFHDKRALAFRKLLDCLLLLQPQAALLECVPAVLEDEFIQSELAHLASLMGWRVDQTILHLHHQWPMRRSRWYCPLRPAAWGGFPLRPWPLCEPTPKVSDVLPSCMGLLG